MRAFKVLFKVGFLKLSSYIEASIVNLMSAVVYVFVQFFVWKSIFNNTPNVDMDFSQLFTYIVLSQTIMYFYPATIGKQLGELIRSGDICFSLLKPMSLIKQLIYENMGMSLYKLFFISLPITVVGLLIGGVHIEHLFAFFIFMVFSYVIYIYIDMLFGLLMFYTSSSWGVNSLKYAIITLCSGRILPLSVYPNWCRKILAFFPFKFTFDIPLGIVTGLQCIDLWTIIELCGWIICMIVLFDILYRNAIKRLSVMGG